MSDVTIKYKGESIATMDATGIKTLGTAGKYCEGDIGVEYVKPSGGTPAIAIVDTPDSHGGVVREITALDISDSTLETADQLARGITGYNKYGVKLTGTASGGSIKRGVIRPDEELVESWSYDKLWIEDEGETLPAYSTNAVTLKASEQLTVSHHWDLDNYKYFVLARGLVIPIYNISTIARGRVEWAESNGAYELVAIEPDTIPALVDPTKFITSRAVAWISSGGPFYRMPYYTNSAGQLSLYAATSYGVWCSLSSPSYASGQLYINSPAFFLRCQANVFDQPFYEALDDIRFQWKIELWREPIGSMQYDGWTANQEFEHILDCVKSASHTLT